MRPLTVIILILGALAALAFAVFSLTSGSVRGESARGGAVTTGPAITRGADLTARELTSLSTPDMPITPAPTLGQSTDSTRKAVPNAQGGTWANTLTGSVRSPEGIPLAGVKVELYLGRVASALAPFHRLVRGGAPDKAQRTTTTGPEGLYVFRALKPSDKWSITATHADYARAEAGPIVLPTKGTVQENIELNSGYRVVGVVREAESGTPIQGATIVLDDQLSMNMGNSQRVGPHQQTTQSDMSGKFLFSRLSSMTYSLVCKRQGFGSLLKTNISVMGETTTVEVLFDLEIGQILAGRVVDAQGAGVEGAVIDAMSHSSTNRDRGISKGSAVSSSDGEFLIEDVVEGTYTISAKAQGFQPDSPTRIKSGKTDIILRMSRQGSILGRAVDGKTGKPIRDFEVKVRAVNPATPQMASRGRVVGQSKISGSSDGHFEVGGVSEGTYIVQANARGYANSFSGRVVVSEGQVTPDVEVRLTRGGTIAGTVVDARTRQPIAGVVVSTHDNNWIDSEFTNLLAGLNDPHVAHQKVTSGADGSFKLTMLSPEVYQVKIASPDHTLVKLNDIRVEDSVERSLGVTMLSAGCSLKGHVFLAAGGPGTGVTVHLQPADGGFTSNMQARTDSEGRYNFRNASPGSYKLSASRPTKQGNPFQTIVDMQNSEKEVILVEGGVENITLHIGSD